MKELTSYEENNKELIRIFNLANGVLGKEYILENNWSEDYNADMLRITRSGTLEDVTISIVTIEEETNTFINLWIYTYSTYNAKYISFLERLKDEDITINFDDCGEDYTPKEAIPIIQYQDKEDK